MRRSTCRAAVGSSWWRTREASAVTISVRDTGIGIPPEMIGRIFDMFTQVDGSLERAHGGLGIGLTLVKRLVEMHGGSVEARSEGVNQGSEFIVRLPIVVELLGESHQNDGDVPAPSGKRRILVVDDNENAAQVMGMLLKALGNEVQTAFDGLTAIELAERFRPDAMLLDHRYAEDEWLRGGATYSEAAVGKEYRAGRADGLGPGRRQATNSRGGFDHHFVKPLDLAVLQRFLAECVSQP